VRLSDDGQVRDLNGLRGATVDRWLAPVVDDHDLERGSGLVQTGKR
jgi:hypothetical protein